MQILGRDVTGLDQKQPPRAPLEDMRIHKIGIPGDDNSLFSHGNLTNNRIFRPIAGRKIQRMNRIMSTFYEKSTETAGKVCIEEKLHVKAR